MIKQLLITYTKSNHIGAVILGKHTIITYAPKKEFNNFIQALKEEYPDYKCTLTLNDEIRQKIEKQITADLLMENKIKKDYTR